MRINLAALILLAMISNLAHAGDNQSKTSVIVRLNPQQILAQCHDPDGSGPIGVMREITHPTGKDYDWDVWNEITEKIAQGDADWIRASGCLAHGAKYGGCASCSTMLNVAWAHALRTNTHAVLGLRQWTSIDEACALPFLEEDEEFLADYMKTTLAALNALATTPEDYADVVQDARRSCTWSLRASYGDPNRCKYNGDEYICPEARQNCKFNGESYYDCKPE